MPATVVIVVKILPESPSTDLAKMKELAKAALEPLGAKNVSFEERPIAFGLKALIVKTDMPEEKGTDAVEAALAKLPEVSSVSIEDYRRAFG